MEERSRDSIKIESILKKAEEKEEFFKREEKRTNNMKT
jgi:hypothetical protein